jgi:hypothetical protein
MQFIEARNYSTVDPQHAERIKSNIRNSKIFSEPFPHLYIQDVFPFALYRAMERDLPRDEAWNASGAYAPHFSLVADDAPASLKEASLAWQARYSGYIDLLNRLLFERLQRPIKKVFKRYSALGLTNGNLQFGTGQSVFCRRPSGWQITPHSHNMQEIVQSLIYFPIAGSPRSLGTRLFRALPNASLPRDHIQRRDSSWDQLYIERAGAVPYEPNALFAFVNSPIAVHAAEETEGMPARQYIFTKVVFGQDALIEPQDGFVTASDFLPRPSLVSRALDPLRALANGAHGRTNSTR